MRRFYPGTDLREVGVTYSWRTLRALITNLPPESALARAMYGENASWGAAEYLLAETVDALRVANWQRTEDGGKGRNRPDPIHRPGQPEPTGPRPPTPAVSAFFEKWRRGELKVVEERTETG